MAKRRASILRGYTWEPDLQQYRGPRGTFVKRQKITALLERSINGRERRILDGAQALYDGKITPKVYAARTAELVKRQHLQNSALAAGGWDRLTPADYGRIGGNLRSEYKHLASLANGIADGTVSTAQAQNRLHMYMGNARKEFYAVERAHLPKPKAGMTRLERRQLNPADHCFPAGTLILTDDGTVPIEDITVGQMVMTRLGYKPVTKLYYKQYSGELVTLCCGILAVTCTPNHPFAIGPKQWRDAGSLGSGDQVVIAQYNDQMLQGKGRFPDMYHGITNHAQKSVPYPIPVSLGILAREPGIKSRMPMPPISINLDDDIMNPAVGQVAVRDNHLSLIWDTQQIKGSKQVGFQSAGRMSISSLFGEEQSTPLFRVSNAFAALCDKTFSCLRGLAGIMFSHVFGGSIVDKAPVNGLVQSDAGFMGAIAHDVFFKAKNSSDSCLPLGGITGTDKIVFRLCPIVDRRMMDNTVLPLAITSVAADRANLEGVLCHSASPHGLHRHNDMPHYSDSASVKQVIVYNLEVADAHEYIANGFVVHNCDDCVGYAAQGWQAEGVLPVPGEGSQCDGNCRCSLDRKEAPIADAGSMIGTGGATA